MRRVSVFGGSTPKPGEPPYQEAQNLGASLGAAGCIVLTGGYIGTMEAVSRGAAEAGGHVIGVTCDEIEVWRPIKPNRWVQEELRFPSLRERLFAITHECQAAIALPGGVGTLNEIAFMWSQMQTGVMPEKPLVLVGEGWRAVFEALFSFHESYILPTYRELLSFAPDADAAFTRLFP